MSASGGGLLLLSICMSPAGLGICGIQEFYLRVSWDWKTVSLWPPISIPPSFLMSNGQEGKNDTRNTFHLLNDD